MQNSPRGAIKETHPVELPELSVGVADADEDRRRRIALALGRDGLSVVAQHDEAHGLVGSGNGDLDAAVLAADALGPAEFASIAMIRESLPQTNVVAVAGSLGHRSIRSALSAGANAIVLETRLDECLALAVRIASVGQITLPRDWRTQLERPTLSNRQKQILGMVVLGFTNGEIARKLYLTENTVKSHLSTAFKKLGVNSRNEATAVILDPENGLGTGILAISSAESPEAAERRPGTHDQDEPR